MRVALTALVLACAGGAIAAGVYDPAPGAYSPEQDPKTIVRRGVGVGSVRFDERIATVSTRDFGPVHSRKTIPGRPTRPRGWLVRRYAGIDVVARMDGSKRIVAFMITSAGYQTRTGLGVGDRLAGARDAFGPARRLTATRTAVTWRIGSGRGLVYLRTDTRGKIVRWAIATDPVLSPTAILGG